MIQLKLTTAGATALANTLNIPLTITHFLCGSSYDEEEQAIQTATPFQFDIAYQQTYVKGQQYEKDGVTVTETNNHIKIIGFLSSDDITFEEDEYTVKEIALIGSVSGNNICLAYGYDIDGIKLQQGSEIRYTVKLDLVFDRTPNITVTSSINNGVTYSDFQDHIDNVLDSSTPVHGLTYVNNRLYINGSPLVIDVSGVKNTSFNGAIGISEEVEVLPSASTEVTGKVVIDKETGIMSQVVETGGVKSWQTLYPLLTQINAMGFLPLRQDSTPYAVGDVVKIAGLSPFQYLECVVAGTTGTTISVYANVGELVTDGTVKWLVLDLRDSAPVGTIKQDIIKRDGWLKLNGATVNVADYPRLVSFLTANSLLNAYTATPDSTKFYYGDSNNETLLLPDFGGLFIENSASNTLQAVNAGLPDITGIFTFDLPNTTRIRALGGTGAFNSINNISEIKKLTPTSGTESGNKDFEFKASYSNSIYGNSNTVQPPAVKLLPIIKY